MILGWKSEVIILGLSPNSPRLFRLAGNTTAHHERDVKRASHLWGLVSHGPTLLLSPATNGINLQHPWLVRISLAAQNI